MSRAYFDHAANSPMPPPVAAAMAEVMAEGGNPGSLHTAGRQARRRLEEARESLAASLGAQPSEVVFTSGGTEANNLVLLGTRREQALLISAIEHPSVAHVRARREAVTVLAVDEFGGVDHAQAAAVLDAGAGLVSVMWVNNETGVINDIAALSEIAHHAGAVMHTDAVQALGHIEVDFAASGADLASVSAHKLGGPVGIGAVVVRRGIRVAPLGFGGEQEAKLRSGTVPVALAVGFAAAARIAQEQQAREAQRLAGLRAQLLAGALAVGGVVDNSAPQHSPAIVNLTFTGTRADDLLLLLDAAGVDASTGSACTAGLHQPSEVLMAMGRDQKAASSSLRFSLGWSTSADDVQHLLSALGPAVAQARRASA